MLIPKLVRDMIIILMLLSAVELLICQVMLQRFYLFLVSHLELNKYKVSGVDLLNLRCVSETAMGIKSRHRETLRCFFSVGDYTGKILWNQWHFNESMLN
jgi:hypothetical protein